MPNSPNPEAPNDLRARLDVMVRERVKQRSISQLVGKSHLFFYPLVALDLLSERDDLRSQLDASQARVGKMKEALEAMLKCSACENGCDPTDMSCATNLAHAALQASSPLPGSTEVE